MAVAAPEPVAASLSAAVEAACRAGAPSALLRVEDCQAGWSWSGTAGTLAQDRGPAVSQNTPFRIASVTKNVTAALALRLVSDGVLELDKPLASSEAGEIVRELPHGEQLTLRHLLAHTSGLLNYSFDDDFRRRLMSDPRRPWTADELYAEIRRLGALGEPGAFSYSDSGYVVAGLIIQRALGQPLHVTMRRYIFDPIGMDGTWLEGHEEPRGPAMAHHYDGATDLSEITPTWDWAGGGLVSTLADLARYTREIIRSASRSGGPLAEMRAWTAGATFPPDSLPHYDRYGLGFGQEAFAATDLVGHTGFIGSFIWWWPERDLVLVGTHNRRDIDRRPLIEAVINAS